MAFKALKTISKTEDELRIGNYIILFNSRDLEFVRKGANADGTLGEYFDPSVDVESPYTKAGRFPVDFEHREDPEVKDDVLGYVDWSTAKRDDYGIFVERVLNRRKQYIKMLEPLIDAGLIGNSSEAPKQLTKIKPDGGIIQWGLIRDTLTVNPAEPRMLGDNVVSALKSLSSVVPAAQVLLDSWQVKQTGDQSGQPGGGAVKASAGTSRVITGRKSLSTREKTMDILEAIKQLVPGLNPEQLAQIAAVMGLTGMGVATGDEALIDETGKSMKSVKMSDLVKELKALGYPVVLPGQQMVKKAIQRPIMEMSAVTGTKGVDGLESEEDPEVAARKKSIEAFHILRFHEESDAQKAIQSDLIGKNYQQTLYEQNIAYARYVRHGNEGLDIKMRSALKSLYFPMEQVIWMLKEGYDVATVKAVQVEAIGEMGGYAVPPEHSSEISKRLPGLTAIRGGGAKIITLATSNSTEIPQWRGNSDAYIGLLRGEWGGETNAPADKNFKLDMIDVVANVYNLPVWMSMSAVQDAANIVSLLDEDMVSTAAIDEDVKFLTGNGVKCPYGMLPDGANKLSLTEVKSGGSSTLTAAGIKALKRGVASQYRQKGVWVANSDTYSAVEQLTYTTGGEFAFPDLSDEEKLLNRKAFESEAMPDIAANAFPILFGDMSGYTIVERLGMTIERFHDSYTGSNKVKFELRRRVGGRLEKPWMLAVQKVAS